jgi:hypothetical protein
MAFERLEPDPAEVSMRILASMAALLHNVYRDRKRHPRPFTAAEFLPTPIEADVIRENRRRWNAALTEMRANYARRARAS